MAQDASHGRTNRSRERSNPPGSAGNSATPLRREATQAEIDCLPHVTDSVPFAAWAVIVAGAAERFTYFGIIAP